MNAAGKALAVSIARDYATSDYDIDELARRIEWLVKECIERGYTNENAWPQD